MYFNMYKDQSQALQFNALNILVYSRKNYQAKQIVINILQRGIIQIFWMLKAVKARLAEAG